MDTKDRLSKGLWPSDEVQSSNCKVSQIGISRFGVPSWNYQQDHQDNFIPEVYPLIEKVTGVQVVTLECDSQS